MPAYSGHMHIFTYGSLMFEGVWQKIVKGRYQQSTATTQKMLRRKIKGDSYPVAVRADSSCTLEGTIYFDISKRDLARLDSFEGKLYYRETIDALLPTGSRIPADIYLLRRRYHSRLSKQVWNPNDFTKREMKSLFKQNL